MRFKIMIALLLPLAIIGLYRPSYGEDLSKGWAPSSHFVSGNQYLELNETQQFYWLMGALDGILTANSDAYSKTDPSPDKSKIIWLTNCLNVNKMPISQMKAIFEKKLKALPSMWDLSAGFFLQFSIREACRKKVNIQSPKRRNP